MESDYFTNDQRLLIFYFLIGFAVVYSIMIIKHTGRFPTILRWSKGTVFLQGFYIY